MRIAIIPAAAACTAALIATAPAAHADADADYLATLARHGVTGDPGALIGAGHDVCWAFDQNWLAGIALWKAQAEYAGQGVTGTGYDQAQTRRDQHVMPRPRMVAGLRNGENEMTTTTHERPTQIENRCRNCGKTWTAPVGTRPDRDGGRIRKRHFCSTECRDDHRARVK